VFTAQTTSLMFLASTRTDDLVAVHAFVVMVIKRILTAVGAFHIKKVYLLQPAHFMKPIFSIPTFLLQPVQ
jgi:hypothetical protein